jgi:hypothetical protein
MSHDAFYIRTADATFAPTRFTVGPWDDRLQHGGPGAALLYCAMAATAPRPGTRLAHFALEFLGPVPLAPMQVSAEVVRPGKKIELLSATASIAGRPALRASAWRVATQPDRTPAANLAEAPPPRTEVTVTPRFPGRPAFGYGEALEWRLTSGGYEALGPATAWTRLLVDIVQGEPADPLAHALAMVDSANGMSAELDVRHYLFVPVNLTVSIARAPTGQWIGMSARTEIASEGAGTTHARLFDDHGYFGQALQSLYVEPRA